MTNKNSFLILISLIFISLPTNAENIKVHNDYPFSEAEKYISSILEREVPYSTRILNINWVIKDHNTYPAGTLTQMFANYLIENNIIKDKRVADIGSSGFAIGVIAAKNGAKEVVGTSITPEAGDNAKENIIGNNVGDIARIITGSGVAPLLPKYKGKIDVIVSGPPWNTISSESLNKVPEHRKALTLLFYDVEDKLITDILSNGRLLLTPSGKIFITASLKTIDRIKALCAANNVDYKIVKKEDLHDDGNLHYILRLTPQK